VLLSIQGGSDLGLFEINEAAQLVANSAAVDANIIFGAVIDDALGDEVRVTVIAAGLDENRNGRSAGSGAARVGSGANTFGSSGSGGTGATTAKAGGATPRPGRVEPVSRYVPPVDDVSPEEDTAPAWDADPEMSAYDSESDEMATAGLAAMLSAPVMGTENGTGRHVPVYGAADQDDDPDGAALYDTPEHLSDATYSSVPRSARAEGRTFDVPTSRRRPVVFEEDDDLDVPDFLK
jgi:cell division protein FtsZ